MTGIPLGMAPNPSLLNGEGYGNIEVDAGKAVQARFTVDPLAAGGGNG